MPSACCITNILSLVSCSAHAAKPQRQTMRHAVLLETTRLTWKLLDILTLQAKGFCTQYDFLT